MKKTLFFIILGIIILLILPFFVRIHRHEGFKGKVIDNITGKPISGVKVVCAWWVVYSLIFDNAVDSEGAGKTEAITDENGEFIMPGVFRPSIHLFGELQKQTISIEAKGYKPYYYVTTREGFINKDIIIRLQPEDFDEAKRLWISEIKDIRNYELIKGKEVSFNLVVSTKNSIMLIEGKEGKIIWGHKTDLSPENHFFIIEDLNQDEAKDILVCELQEIPYDRFHCSMEELSKIYTLNSKNGEIIWLKNINEIITQREEPPPIWLKDLNQDGIEDIMFENNKGEIYLVDSRNGKELWKNKEFVVNHSYNPPLFIFGKFNDDNIFDIIHFSEDQGVVALDGKDSKTLWKLLTFAQGVNKMVAIDDINDDEVNDILIIVESGKIYAIDGKEASTIWVRDYYPRYGPTQLKDIGNDKISDIIFVTWEERIANIVVLNAKDGKTIWQVKIDDFPRAVTSEEITEDNILDVIVVTDDSILGLNGKNGEIVWSYETVDGIKLLSFGDLSEDGLLDGVFFRPWEREKIIYAINLKNGKIIWAIQLPIPTYSLDKVIIGNISDHGMVEVILMYKDKLEVITP